jgi:hypothetical protein
MNLCRVGYRIDADTDDDEPRVALVAATSPDDAIEVPQAREVNGSASRKLY